jgi:hypothetical protein
LEKRAEQILSGARGQGGVRGEMAQTMDAHISELKKKSQGFKLHNYVGNLVFHFFI